MLSQAKSILVKYTYNLHSSRLSTQVSQALWEILSTQVSQALWEIPLFSTGTVDVVYQRNYKDLCSKNEYS